MALVVTDAIDPGPPMVCDGISPRTGGGTIVANSTSGTKQLVQKLLTLTYSGTYTTGGTTLTVAQMSGVAVLFAAQGGPAGGLLVVPTYHADGTLTLKLYWRAANTAVLGEVPNTTAISDVIRLLVIGREA